MSKLTRATRTALGTATVATGGLFGLGIVKVPEQYRGHLPHVFDIASTAGNFLPGLGIGVFGMWLARKETRKNRIRIATGVLALGVSLNVLAENHTANVAATGIMQNLDLQPQYILGDGKGGENRDIAYGIGGTALGVALSSIGRKVEDEEDSSSDDSGV